MRTERELEVEPRLGRRLCQEHAHGNWQLNGQQTRPNGSPGTADGGMLDCKQFYELDCNNLRNFIDTWLLL